ncbi:hypothetical protein CAP36_10100 [Chitinophagaceae bacterium IBVUCB2]|nr:hypothetical protein CAP36_10100 [Chitinophagaceae bacterium IBVUCB2]
MKISIAALSLFFMLPVLSSCKSKDEKTNTPATSVHAKDSAAIIQPESALNPYSPVDLSPMDMSYYPPDYPKIKMANPGSPAPKARVVYSRPHLQGRQLFPGVLKYDTAWRLGANESSELQLYNDAMIQNQKINAGRYIIYCIPKAETWTIILNSNTDSWGLHHDVSKDVASFVVPVIKTNQRIEFFTMVFEKKTDVVELLMAWDNVEARLPIIF